MIQIVKSLLGVSDIEFCNELNLILAEQKCLSPDELDVFNYLSKAYEQTKQFPTKEVFLTKYPQYRFQVEEYKAFGLEDLRYYRKQFLTIHNNINKAQLLRKLAESVSVSGLTPEMVDLVRQAASFEEVKEETTLSFRERYTKSMKENSGLKTFVPQIDEEIGSLAKGSVTIIAGFSASFKSTWALNMAVRNALQGKNIAYISLEITKEQLEYSILSLFSNDNRFSMQGYSPLEHQKIRQNKLSEDELNFLCDVLEPAYRKIIEPNLHLLDETCFDTFSESEILDKLIQLDDIKPLDAVFFDHAGLFAFKSPLYNSGNVGAAINKYVSFIRELSISFRIKNGEKRALTSVVLAQTNRTGFKQASASFRKLNQINRAGDRNQTLNTSIEGYTLTALSDANSLERDATVVMSVFVNDEMKAAGQAYVQLLKTRYGSNVQPMPVDIVPEYYLFGGDASVDESELSADLLDSLASVSSSSSLGTTIEVDDDDLFGL